MELIDFIVLALAVARLANLLADTQQAGPFQLMHRIRSFVGVEFDEYSVPHGRNQVAEAVMCVYCNSVWLGLLATLAWLVWPGPVFWLALPLALSAVAIHVGRVEYG